MHINFGILISIALFVYPAWTIGTIQATPDYKDFHQLSKNVLGHLTTLYWILGAAAFIFRDEIDQHIRHIF
jgi:hypothetical protein